MAISTFFDAVLVPLLIILGLVMRRSSGISLIMPGEVVRGAGLGNKEGGRSAFLTSLAATVGTANIVGAAGAVMKGGPGALVWMWLCGFLGMGVKYGEAVLAVKFSVSDQNGGLLGGPMYCMERTMEKNGRFLGKLYSAAGIFGAFVIGALWQSASAANMLSDTVQSFFPLMPSALLLRVALGILAALASLAVMFGGGKRTMRISEKIVPVMCFAYTAAAIGVIVANMNRLPLVLCEVFKGVFTPGAMTGGTLSGGISSILSTAAIGLQTGTFSGEAGLGSAGISYAFGGERDPVRAGFCGMIEVFTDTMMICTLSVLAVLCSGTELYSSASSTQTILNAFSSVFGGTFAGVLLSISILLFAFSSIFTWSWYGAACIGYLTNRPLYEGLYETAIAVTVFIGAFLDNSLLVGMISVSNTLLVIPNSFLLISNRKIIKSETNRYLEALKNNKDKNAGTVTQRKQQGISQKKD